jgi:PAS domain S-box-containing protein
MNQGAMMTEKPSYEELQQRVRELEAGKAVQSTQNGAIRKLFYLSLDMLCVADFDGYFRVINAAFENTLGYSRQVLLETPFIEFVHPDDRVKTREASAITKREPVTYFENRYRCKDGSFKWLAWTAVPVTEEGLVYAVARDITKQKTVQYELAAQRDLFDNVLSHVPASIFWKDRNSVYLGANMQFAHDTGLQSPDELIGKSDYDLAWTRAEADFYRECDRKVMDSGEPMLNIEESQQQADGKEVTLLTSKVPLLDRSGQVYGMLGIYMDITRRKQTEDSLQKSEARLRTLFDSAAELIFLIDTEGRILNANRQVYEQSGYNADEVLGCNIKEFFSEESQKLCDCNFPALRERGYNRADIEFVCKDGHVLQMECSATAIPDEKGDFTTFLIIQRDVTERTRAAAALALSEKRFRTIFNSSHQLIGMLDPDGILLDANQTALDVVGLKQEEVVGRAFWDIYCWSYSTDVQNRIKAAVQEASQGKPVGYEEDMLDGDGNIRTIDFTLKPVVDQQGNTVLIIPEGRDITDLKRAEQETLRHHKEMAHVTRLSTAGEMASGMAHELNQPLTALLSYCGTAKSLVNSMSSPPPQLGEILERATEQAHRAGDIIRHLRDFVSKGDNHRKLLDLDQVIRDIIIFLKHEVQASDVRINFYPGCHARKVMADKMQIEQVLINLVRNSLEAIGGAKISGGQVIIQSRLLSNDSVEVTVSDNGPGISPDMVDIVFHPFQTNKPSGMGIGLSLSSTIIETHGGKLRVDKDYQDGALFGFELPVSE